MQLAWDPEIDTPATIAVIGGGSIGVEAALYGRFLGYTVLLFDAHKVGHRQLAWGEHLMQESWSQVTTSLGLAAIEAQGTASDFPADDTCCTYREYVEKYLLPVARTDLLYDGVQINSPVVSVSRTGCSLNSPASITRRAEQEFRVLVDSSPRGEYSQLVDIVLDCSGLAPRRGLASGSGLAIGEIANRAKMLSGKVDVLGKHRARFAGMQTLLFGRDLTACANAIDLARLATEVEGTRITWVVPKLIGTKESFEQLPDGPGDLAATAQRLIANQHPAVVSLPAWGIESLQHQTDWTVRLQTGEEETLDIRGDNFINCHSLTRDWSFCDSLALTTTASDHGTSPEPHYYLLGDKLLDGPCKISEGLAHVRRVFALIGGRVDLDLYATIPRQTASA